MFGRVKSLDAILATAEVKSLQQALGVCQSNCAAGCV